MGRSVSVPSNAELVVYSYYQEYFGRIEEDIRAVSKWYWKSLSDCDIWLDREDRAILENELVYIGVSEYCGIVSIWIVSKDTDNPSLARNWIVQISKRFKSLFGTLNKVGTLSNGESVFEEIRN